MDKFTKLLQIRVTEEMNRQLQAEAAKRGIPVADFVRNLLAQALSEAAAREGLGAVVAAVRQAIRPTENRLAAMLQKAVIAAATSMYLNTQVIADAGREDAVDLYHAARKKAAQFLREKQDKQGEENGD